jgi:hypothetical protein
VVCCLCFPFTAVRLGQNAHARAADAGFAFAEGASRQSCISQGGIVKNYNSLIGRSFYYMALCLTDVKHFAKLELVISVTEHFFLQ